MMQIYSNPEQLTSPMIARALQKCTHAPIVTDDCDYGGTWAGFGDPRFVESLRATIKDGRDWYYADHSYFKTGRKTYFRITRNAWQHDGISGKPDYHRLSEFYTSAAPFKKDGRHILICMHSEHFHERVGSPFRPYRESLVRRIQLYSDRPIVVRTKRSDSRFLEDLRGAWAVVTHSSMSALEALMRGIPAFMTSDSALASLTMRDPINIERPFYPCEQQRMQVAAVLAGQQWTLTEIANNKAWRELHETV